MESVAVYICPVAVEVIELCPSLCDGEDAGIGSVDKVDVGLFDADPFAEVGTTFSVSGITVVFPVGALTVIVRVAGGTAVLAVSEAAFCSIGCILVSTGFSWSAGGFCVAVAGGVGTFGVCGADFISVLLGATALV